MTKLHISPTLSLPIEAVTQAIGIVAKRRVGKSYTARRFAEQLVKAGQQVVIVDPKGDWWGIRSSADGKSPGLPVVILGGERGDVPLDSSNGEIVAKLVVEERVSALLDLSHLRKKQIAVFMADFLETLYRLKAKEVFRTPVMVIVDEADAIAPQKPQDGEERMLGAAEDVVRRGGQRGIGCMMITQRSAVLNKNVLTQCEMLVALRTISPQDLKAMQAWIDVHGSPEERDTLMESLPSLPRGDAWFWSPGWPTEDGIFKRVTVLPIETFDSGATPKAGEKRVEPKTVADVDLPALQRQMAATIEKAKADDPKELKREIASLRSQLTKAQKGGIALQHPKGVIDQTAIDRAVAKALGEQRTIIANTDRQRNRLLTLTTKHLEEIGSHLHKVAANISEVAGVKVELAALPSTNGHGVGVLARSPRPPKSVGTTLTAPATRLPRHVPREPVEGLSRGQQKILNALAELHAIGIERTTRQQLGMFAGYNLTGGSGAQHIADLVQLGLVEIPGQGSVQLTEAGHAAADATDVPQTLEELHQRALAKASSGQRRIAEHLISIYPEGISRADLGATVGYNLTGGSGAQHVADLVTLGVATIPRTGQVAASDLLFPEGLR